MMKPLSTLMLGISLSLASLIPLSALTLAEQAQQKIDELNSLIDSATTAGYDVSKEEMTVHTAEIFLEYALWDENNVATNTTQFESHATYSSNAQQMAEDLPDWERQEIISFLDKQIAEITQVLNGEITRPTVFWPDWTQLVVENDQITQNGQAVFLADYIWKPASDDLETYYGDLDTEGMRSVYMNDLEGSYNTWAYNNLFVNHEGNTPGQIWTDNNNIPDWIKEMYPEIEDGGRHYGHYDVDHPAMRELYADMFARYVPPIADKKVTDLGYQLFNEPSFFTKEGAWNNADEHTGKCVSDCTIVKFKGWLEDLHGDIATLNNLWGSSFASFNDVTVTLPMPGALQGGAIWYDWMTFNNYRITDWFQFMTDEIKKYDSDARTHIKLMPWTFTSNSKDHGLDFEALTELSGIIGCDAGMQYDHSWDNSGWWRTNYALDWKPALMTFDFMKSVKPESFIFDTENHFMMNTGFNLQDLDQDYVRMSYWLGAMHGLTAKCTWVWTRDADGSMTRSPGQSNMTDMSHQPQTLHTVTSTFMDLNTFGKEMVAIQRLAKPIRIFYSKTSSINDDSYSDKIFEVYKKLFFEGIPVGFATQNILDKAHDGELVIVHNTQYVTQPELDALQAYLDNGGTIIMGSNSLSHDQYNRALSDLNQSNGTIINAADLDAIYSSTLSVIESKGLSPKITIDESNDNNVKGCTWKTFKQDDGSHIISIINLGNKTASLDIGFANGDAIVLTDLFTGNAVNASTSLAPFGVLFLEAKMPGAEANDSIISHTMPTSMGVDETVTFSITYETTQERDLHIDLQDKTAWQGHGSIIETVNGSGTINLEFTPNAGTTAGPHRWNIYLTVKGENWQSTIEGADLKVNVEVEDLATSNNLNTSSNLITYPQPCKNSLTLKTNTTMTSLKLYTLSGRLIAEKTIKKDHFTMPTSHLAEGAYLLHVTFDDGSKYVDKVIKN